MDAKKLSRYLQWADKQQQSCYCQRHKCQQNIFSQTAFFIEINEAEDVNKVVVVLFATDVDLLLSGTVVYEM